MASANLQGQGLQVAGNGGMLQPGYNGPGVHIANSASNGALKTGPGAPSNPVPEVGRKPKACRQWNLPSLFWRA